MSNYIKVLPAVSTPIGATLMKTGQTTSYRTGDDGDLEVGRATNFFTLPSNNPFGNTNRFTSELGTQTYTNNIVIDWSTYSGNTVLGYNRVSIATSRTWAAQIDFALAFSVGTYTSGWRLANCLEYANIFNFDHVTYGASGLNYPPFNNSVTSNHWTSTSRDATFAYARANRELFLDNVVNNRSGIVCRTFTVTGTTLT